MSSNRGTGVGRAVLAGWAVWAMSAAMASSAEPIGVSVAIGPVGEFASRVGGSLTKVQVLVGSGQSPHMFEPTAKQMAELGRAKVYFTLELPFEKVMVEKVRKINPSLKVVSLRQGVKMRSTEEGGCSCGHDHGDKATSGATSKPAHADGDGDHDDKHDADADHDHAAHAGHDHAKHDDHDGCSDDELDPHIWMSPANAKIMCGTIATTLKSLDSSHAETIDANLAKYRKELTEVDEAIAKELKPFKGGTFLVYHDAFGYFGDHYGMTQESIEMGGKQPSAKRLAELIDEAKKDNVKIIFVQPQYSARSAEAIAKAIGGAVVSIDPESSSYVKNLRDIGEKIARAMRAAKDGKK